jgi:hypothetical protein
MFWPEKLITIGVVRLNDSCESWEKIRVFIDAFPGKIEVW